MLTLEQIIKDVSSVAKEFNIKSITLFGSYADGTNTDESDVDLLIEFNTSAVSLLTLSALKNRIEDILNLPVDIIHAPLPESSLIEIGKAVQIYAS